MRRVLVSLVLGAFALASVAVAQTPGPTVKPARSGTAKTSVKAAHAGHVAHVSKKRTPRHAWRKKTAPPKASRNVQQRRSPAKPPVTPARYEA